MIQRAERAFLVGRKTNKEAPPVIKIEPGFDCRPFADLVNLNGSTIRVLQFGDKGSIILRASMWSADAHPDPISRPTFIIGPRLFPIDEATELTIEAPKEGPALPRTKLRIMTSVGGGIITIEPPAGPEASGQYTTLYAGQAGRLIVPKFNQPTLVDQLRTLSVGLTNESLH